jgi:hypothetical protein
MNDRVSSDSSSSDSAQNDGAHSSADGDERRGQEPITDSRLNGENFMSAMGELFQRTDTAEESANPAQVLTLAMGKMQSLGLMALYYELRHGNDIQASQTALLKRLADRLDS